MVQRGKGTFVSLWSLLNKTELFQSSCHLSCKISELSDGEQWLETAEWHKSICALGAKEPLGYSAPSHETNIEIIIMNNTVPFFEVVEEVNGWFIILHRNKNNSLGKFTCKLCFIFTQRTEENLSDHWSETWRLHSPWWKVSVLLNHHWNHPSMVTPKKSAWRKLLKCTPTPLSTELPLPIQAVLPADAWVLNLSLPAFFPLEGRPLIVLFLVVIGSALRHSSTFRSQALKKLVMPLGSSKGGKLGKESESSAIS